MNYSTTNSSGTSSVALGVGHFLLFPAPHGGGFVAFCALLKLSPTYIPGWDGSGFTLTGALVVRNMQICIACVITQSGDSNEAKIYFAFGYRLPTSLLIYHFKTVFSH